MDRFMFVFCIQTSADGEALVNGYNRNKCAIYIAR